MKSSSSIGLFVLLVFILPVTAFAVMRLYEKKNRHLPVIESGLRGSHFSLFNQDGQPVTEDSWENKIVVSNFFFTHCPSICPKMMKNLERVRQVYEKDPALIMNSFSVDPERDSVGQLKRYSIQRKFVHPGWQLLTGDKKEIYKLARNGFNIVATDGDGGQEDFIHSQQFVLVDKQQHIRGYYDGTSEKETDRLINDIKKLRHEN